MTKPTKTMPDFADEAAERDFWEREDSADYVDWSNAKVAAKARDGEIRKRARLKNLLNAHTPAPV